MSPSPGDRERGPGPGASPPEDPGAGPGGVELMMSPQVALRQAGSQESSAGGLCRAGLARREAGWTASHWARITQAGPGPRWTQHAPPRARRPAPARSPPHPIPSRLAPRERVLTRENVCRGYDLEDRRRSRDPGGAPGAAARTRVAAGSVLPASKTYANELIDTSPGARTGAATSTTGPPPPAGPHGSPHGRGDETSALTTRTRFTSSRPSPRRLFSGLMVALSCSDHSCAVGPRWSDPRSRG